MPGQQNPVLQETNQVGRRYRAAWEVYRLKSSPAAFQVSCYVEVLTARRGHAHAARRVRHTVRRPIRWLVISLGIQRLKGFLTSSAPQQRPRLPLGCRGLRTQRSEVRAKDRLR
jgi:hypothetical protein